MDGRSHNHTQQTPSVLNVDAFFHYVYEFIAEPLAEVEGIQEEPIPMDHDEDSNVDSSEEYELGQDLMQVRMEATGETQLPVRFIGHCKLAELYDQYSHWHAVNGTGTCTSLSTFRKVWRASWCKLIRIRGDSQHARCNVCSRLSRLRQLAETPSEKNQIQEDHHDHMQKIFADRTIDYRQSKLAEASCRKGCCLSERMLNMA